MDRLAERQDALLLLRNLNTAFGRTARHLHTFNRALFPKGTSSGERISTRLVHVPDIFTCSKMQILLRHVTGPWKTIRSFAVNEGKIRIVVKQTRRLRKVILHYPGCYINSMPLWQVLLWVLYLLLPKSFRSDTVLCMLRSTVPLHLKRTEALRDWEHGAPEREEIRCPST